MKFYSKLWNLASINNAKDIRERLNSISHLEENKPRVKKFTNHVVAIHEWCLFNI